MSITIVVPFGPTLDAGYVPGVTHAPRPRVEAPVLALIDNGKLKAGDVLEALGAALVSRGLAADYFIYKKAAMVPITDAERDDILARADVVVAGLGDCGGCTACSVTDAVRCLEQGVPAFMVATEKFKPFVEGTARQYGADRLHKLYVEHPVWSQKPEWFARTGETLADLVAAALTDDEEDRAPAPPA